MSLSLAGRGARAPFTERTAERRKPGGKEKRQEKERSYAAAPGPGGSDGGGAWGWEGMSDAVRTSGEPLPPLQGSPGSPASGLLVRGAGRLIVAPLLPPMSLPSLKSCLVLFEDSAEASRSKTLSNSAEGPKSHFPHSAARGFSRRPGWARGSPDLTRVVHTPSPASVCLSPWRWSKWQVLPSTLSARPGVLAGLGGAVGRGRSGCGRDKAETLGPATSHLARRPRFPVPLGSGRATLPLALSRQRPFPN